MSRRWLFGAAALAGVLSFAQSPGLIVADTKYDLTQNPIGFLARATHLWSSQAPFGQVQNQAYGYFFPHGSFFALGQLLSIPPWITQRVWWALLLVAGFWGIIRVAEAMGVGSRSSRIIAAVAFALAPRVLTTLGSISSETLPVILAPWVLLPLIHVCTFVSPDSRKCTRARRLAAQSALAVALTGAVNAVATVAACLVAALWWIAHRPNRRWWRFTAWWIPCCLLAVCWWLVPLLLLGKFSPPFLDFIESAGVTTQWTSLAEVLRGTDSWTPFVSPERIAGAVLVTQPAAVVATGLVAAAGLAGLCMRSMPARGRLTLILFVGIVGLAAGYVGELGSPFAEQVRLFLDSGGAPLRNVHKLEPLVRLPLVLGLAHLLAQVPLPGSVPTARWRVALAHPEREPMVALTSLILVALTLATSLAWTGRLAPRGAYPEVPEYWHQAAAWLAENTGSAQASDARRALIVPGAPFGSQFWGLTRDEPIQALATTPWAVRDAVPLTPPGAIRAMDSVQRLLADGLPSAGLAETLLGQGIGYLVLRNDLDPDTSSSTRPLLAHQSIEGSPGIEKVAEFGADVGPQRIDGLVADADLRPRYPAIEIYRVSLPNGAASPAGPYTVDLDRVPVVQGGPEALLRLNARERASAATGNVPASAATGNVPASAATGNVPASAGPHPVLLASDARRAGLPIDAVTVTDSPTDRETDYGQVDNHNSALRGPDDPRRTYNLVPDYPVAGAPLVRGEWEGATITVSSSASDATQLGGTAPGSGPAATVDGDPATGWHSNGLESAVGQWLQLDFDTPIDAGLLHVTTSPAVIGAKVDMLEVTTPNGSTTVRVTRAGDPITVSLPVGHTPWLRITAAHVEDGSAGAQFGITEVSVDDYSNRTHPVPVAIRHRTVLPPTPDGARVLGWDLGQELPGRAGCADAPDRVRCARGLALAPEELNTFGRTLSVPTDTAVTPELILRGRQGPALEALVSGPGRVVAHGPSDISDLRASAFAAVDGDPRTAWSAPEESTRRQGPKPTLTLDLPQPTLVTGLDIAASLGALPAAPTTVAVNLGTGPQVRQLRPEDPTIELAPTVTSHIVLSLVNWTDVLDQTILGFAKLQPPGIAEITVLGAEGRPVAGTGVSPAATDRVVTVGCDAGPVISIAGQRLHTAVTATVRQLSSGAPVTAQLCAGDVPVRADAANPVPLAQGRRDVDVDPGPAFFVDGLRLHGADQVHGAGSALTPEPAATPRGLTTTAWTENHRELQVPASGTDQLLVVPESTNIGWVATAPDGTALAPVVVNGWQQGWVVPAGAAGTVTLDFPTDRWYRLGVFGGLALLIPLLFLALLPGRSRDRDGPGPTPRTWRSVTVAFAGLLVLSTIVAGPVGVTLTLVLSALAATATRLRGSAFAARVLVGVAGTAAALSTAILSTGPWRSPDGYLGHSFLVQLPALVALIALGLAALPLSRSPWWRRTCRRWTARRAGSSTSA